MMVIRKCKTCSYKYKDDEFDDCITVTDNLEQLTRDVI